ncbi:MAG: hypothetical protein VW709_06455, partial [Rickettsiales bacterium]
MAATDDDDVVCHIRVEHGAEFITRQIEVKAKGTGVSRGTFFEPFAISLYHFDLFANTEVAKDHIEKIFDIHPARDPAEGPRRQPHDLSGEIGLA